MWKMAVKWREIGKLIGSTVKTMKLALLEFWWLRKIHSAKIPVYTSAFLVGINQLYQPAEVHSLKLIPPTRLRQLAVLYMYWLHGHSPENHKPMCQWLKVQKGYDHLHPGGYVFTWVCLSLCLSVCLSVNWTTHERLPIKSYVTFL